LEQRLDWKKVVIRCSYWSPCITQTLLVSK